jgi:hypothetical protein
MSETLTSDQQKEIVQRNWLEESALYKAAGVVLRTCVEPAQRSQACAQRIISLERSDQLLDYYNEELGGIDGSHE